MVENREYKSDVFSMLMEDKENALQVYNALNGSSYHDPEQVEMRTLENGFSLSVRNDAAFIVDTNLSIYEHQSTYNPNMPLRSLKYFATILEETIGKRDWYSRRLIRIPTPHFAVFYNGTAERPAREILRLSASYSKQTDKPQLELICTVYNINPDKDKELLRNCKVLKEYTEFIETVRKKEEAEVENPIEEAIEECIRNHILEKFLREKRAEVLENMAIDMTFETREKLFREEEREEGRREGREEGRREGTVSLIKSALHNGKTCEEIAEFLSLPLEQILEVEKK